MSFQDYYNLASAAALLWVGCIWSSKVGLNIVIKTAFIALALGGAVVAARSLGL